jgi:hypothetical protein
MRGRIFLLEVTAWVGPSTQTFYYSSDLGYTTGAGDTPAATQFLPRIIQPGNYTVSAFEQGRTFGASRVGYGEIILDNQDGALDDLVNYGFDGRRAVLRAGYEGDAYPAGFTTVYTATVEQAVFDWDRVVLRLRDRQADLQTPLARDVFAGGNPLPLGLEGNDDDIKGQIKPLVLGQVLNITPPLCNTSKLIYAVSVGTAGAADNITDWDGITDFDGVTSFFGGVSEGCDNVTVYDAGLALTPEADYTSELDMMTTAPSAGCYRVWPAGGYFRLGSTPSGEVTCDASDNTGAAATAKNLITRILETYKGWTTADYSTADLTALDTLNSDSLGVWFNNEIPTVSDILDIVCNSVGACWSFDADGIFRVSRIDPPTGAADFTITGEAIRRLERKSSADTGAGVPAFRVRIKWGRNYTVQRSGLAGAVDNARRAWVAQEYRDEVATDETVLTKHLNSPELPFSTNLIAAPTTEAARRLAIYSVRRDRIEATLDMADLDYTAVRIGSVCQVTLYDPYNDIHRYGYDGKLMLVLGMAVDLARYKITLTLWG